MKTKKLICVIMAVLMLLTGVSFVSSAQEEVTGEQCGDNVYWSYDKNNRKLIFTGTGAIAQGDFPWKNIDDVGSIEFDDGITSIPAECFRGMKNLCHIEFGEKLEYIGDYAFAELESYGVYGSLFPDSLKYIGNYAFYKSGSVEHVEIPVSVEVIGDYAFFGSPGNYRVYSRNVTIGKYALGCDEGDWQHEVNTNPYFTTIYGFAGSTTQEYAVSTGLGCFSVLSPGENADFTFDETTGTLTVTGTGSIYSMSPVISYWMGINPSKIKHVVIGEGITEICSYTFGGCYFIEDVVFPSTLKTIGLCAFQSCGGLKEVEFPAGLEYIGSAAFNTCFSLEKVKFNGDTKLDFQAFSECPSLKEIDLGAKTEIEPCSFMMLYSLESVKIPSTVKSIGAGAFVLCPKLKDVQLGSSVETVGSAAFALNYGLNGIIVPESVKNIEKYAFLTVSPTDVTVLSKDAVIEDEAIGWVTPQPLGEYVGLYEELLKTHKEYFVSLFNNGFEPDEEIKAKMDKIEEEMELLEDQIVVDMDFFDDISSMTFTFSTEKAENYSLTGYKNSTAQAYAEENGFTFRDIETQGVECKKESALHEQCKTLGVNHVLTDSEFDCECGKHNVYVNDIIEATCTEKGYKGGVVCLECEKIFEPAQVIDAKGHTEKVNPGYAATCTKNGRTDETVCEECHAVLIAAKSIPAKGHVDENGDGICDVCSDKYADVEPEPENIGQRIILFMKGIVNAILAIFKKLFG